VAGVAEARAGAREVTARAREEVWRVAAAAVADPQWASSEATLGMGAAATAAATAETMVALVVVSTAMVEAVMATA